VIDEVAMVDRVEADEDEAVEMAGVVDVELSKRKEMFNFNSDQCKTLS